MYQIEIVIEKQKPTEAENKLIVPRMRAGYYLCFVGMHALTPAVIEILGRSLESQPPAIFSNALAELARQEQYLALDTPNRRYDVGVKYGLLRAQLALGLSGRDRVEVLSQLLEAVALRSMEQREDGRRA